MQALIDFFGIKDLIPHGYCLSWSPVLLWLHVASDLLITLAYYSIPLTLIHFLRKRQDLPYPWLVLMFAGFIVSCGTTHLLSAITIWIPLYWLDGLFKGFTAVLSATTAVLMLWLAPRALSLPTTAQLQTEIQQRKSAEEALRVANVELQENAARTQLLLGSALDGIISMDHNGSIIDWNAQAERIFGYSREQALGRKIAELIVPPAYRESHLQGLLRFVSTGVSYIIGTRLEVTGLRADGSEFPLELAIDALGRKDDYFFSAYVRDITERKKAEEVAQAASQYARSLIEASLDPLVTISTEGKITDVNIATEQATGVGRGDLIGSDFADYFTDPDKARDGYRQVFSQGFVTDYPLVIRHVSGKHTDVLYNASVYRDGNGTVLGVFAAARDITERKLIENELKASEAKFRSIIEVSPVPMAMSDEQLNITFLNPAFVQTFGYTLEDIPTMADWWPKAYPDPDYRHWAETSWHRVLEKATQDQADFPAIEVAVRCQNNDTKTVLVTAAAIHHDFTDVHLVILYDITQLKKIEAELTRSNADLEQFAYAVSHDMRQPLRMVSSYLSLIENALAEQLNEETQQFLDFAIDGAKRMDAMILSLLDYSRIGRKFEAKTQISSKTSLDEALAFLNPELDACGGEIKVTGDWPELFASRDELTRLLQNLIGNALKYHEENRPPLVHIHGMTSADSLRVEVRDQGIGIEPGQMDRLFKVFSRLQARSRFEGSGVGLALCRKIVEHHGGTIGVESSGEGQGCVFWFELPIVNAVNSE